MFCKQCGAEMDDNAAFCPKCGAASVAGGTAQPVQAAAPQPTTNVNDHRSGGFAFLSFLWPLIGLILFLVWKDQYPQRAHSCGKGAIIGVIVYVVVGILVGIIVAVSFVGAMSSGLSALLI